MVEEDKPVEPRSDAEPTPQKQEEQQQERPPGAEAAHPIQSAWKVIPCFECRDVRATLRFYTEELGFKGNSHDSDSGGDGGQQEVAERAKERHHQHHHKEHHRHREQHQKEEPHSKHKELHHHKEQQHQKGEQQKEEHKKHHHKEHHHHKEQQKGEQSHAEPQADQPQQPTEEPPPAPDAEPDFCAIAAGPYAAANLYFFRTATPDAPLRPSWAMVALGRKQLEQLWAHVQARGPERVPVVDEIGDRPWGYRQFSVADLDGNKLTFFRFLEGTNPGDEEEGGGDGGEVAAAAAAPAATAPAEGASGD